MNPGTDSLFQAGVLCRVLQDMVPGVEKRAGGPWIDTAAKFAIMFPLLAGLASLGISAGAGVAGGQLMGRIGGVGGADLDPAVVRRRYLAAEYERKRKRLEERSRLMEQLKKLQQQQIKSRDLF